MVIGCRAALPRRGSAARDAPGIHEAACVVDQQVQRLPRGQKLRSQRLGLRDAGKVCHVQLDVAARLRHDGVASSLPSLLITTHEVHRSALARQIQSCRVPDALVGASHDRHAPLQVHVQVPDASQARQL